MDYYSLPKRKAFNERKSKAREAFLRRLECYWRAKNFPRISTYVGEIYEVDFGENVGSEFSGRHLALCLSDTTITQDRLLVIPLTTKYKHYNLQHIVDTYSYNGEHIEAGVMLNEARLISKLRLFSQSLILNETEDDGIYAVAKIPLSKKQLKMYREVSV